jgi:hypothetical protein
MPKSTLELDPVLKPERPKGSGIAPLSSVIQERGRGREARLCLMMMTISRWRWRDDMTGDLRCRRRRILGSRRWRRGKFTCRIEGVGCVCEASFLRGSCNYSYSMLQARSTPKTPISQLTGITASHLLSTTVGSSASHSFLYSIGAT